MRSHGWLLLAVAGCSSEAVAPTNQPPAASIPADRLDEEMTRARCELLFRCCDSSKLFTDAPSATLADCERLLVDDVRKDLEPIQTAITSGRATYDGSAARACVDAVAKRACFGSTSDAGCGALIAGKLADGTRCDYAFECVSGFCQRTCMRLPTIGEACAGFFCGSGAYCDRGTFTCAAQKLTGSACTSSEECESGHCDASKCADKIADGARCTSSPSCASAFCSSAGICEPYREGLCYTR